MTALEQDLAYLMEQERTVGLTDAEYAQLSYVKHELAYHYNNIGWDDQPLPYMGGGVKCHMGVDTQRGVWYTIGDCDGKKQV